MSQKDAKCHFVNSNRNTPRNSISPLFRFMCIFIAVLSLHACTTMKIPDYPKSSVNSLPNSITIDGLTIAVQPVTNKEDLEKYFGTDLYSLKIVPIYIVAENANATSSFLLSKEKVSLQNKKVTSSLTEGARTKGKSATGEGMEIASLVFAGGLAGLALERVGMKMVSDAEVVKCNLGAKEMQTRTVSPGKSVDGFVYFKLPDEGGGLENWIILIEAKELGSGTIHQFKFPAQ